MDWIHLAQDSSREHDKLSNSLNGREFLDLRNCQFPKKASAALCYHIQVTTRHACAVGPICTYMQWLCVFGKSKIVLYQLLERRSPMHVTGMFTCLTNPHKIYILSSIMAIETSYRYYKTESSIVSENFSGFVSSLVNIMKSIFETCWSTTNFM
jgi:hypothetical protein